MFQETRKIICGSFLRSFNLFANIAISFFLMPFIVHSLGDKLYGLWSLVSIFIGYYGLMEFGVAAAVERYIAGAIGSEDQEECNVVFNSALFIFLGLGLIAFLISCLLAGLSSMIFKVPEEAFLFQKIIIILGINAFINFPAKAFMGVLTAQLRHDILALIEVISLVLRSILIIWVLNAGFQLIALSLVTLLANIPEKILFIYFAKRNLPSLRVNIKYWLQKTSKTLFSYSVFKFIAQLADILRFKLDEFVITISIGLSAVTHYHIAGQLSIYFISLMTACMAILKPIFSRYDGANNKEAIKKIFFSATKISIFISSFVGFTLIILGKPFIHRWMGQEYLDAYPSLVFLCVGCTASLWQIPSVFLMYGISKHKFYAFLNLGEGIANLLLSLILVRYFGITGVAIGTFIPMIISKLVLQPIYVCQIISIKYTDYLFFIAKTVMIIFVSLIFPLIVSFRYAWPDYLSLVTVVIVSGCCYSLSFWLLGLEAKEKNFFLQAIIPKAWRRESW